MAKIKDNNLSEENSRDNSEVYVKIDRADALQSKKDLLEATASLIKMEMAVGKIKASGKNEVRIANNLKKSSKEMNLAIKKINEDLPKVDMQKVQLAKRREDQGKGLHTKIKNEELSKELLEIKKKLEGMKF